MIPVFLVLVGLGALVGGWLAMGRMGGGARVGRILAVTPVVGVAQARAIAESGPVRYVAVLGRLDSEHEFEDEHHRPLVYRRTRLETRSEAGWTAIEDAREVVPFELSETLERIAVDGDALDEGLIVVTREAEGTAADVPDRVPDGTPPATPVRLRVQQLSTVDHALVLGVPVADAARGPILRPGLGRPLILTNLERDEAMRLLAAGRHGTAWLASALLAVGVVLVGLGLAWGAVDALALAPAAALAASPDPTAAAGGDPRSSGQGPGLVGDPLAAIIVVAAIALLALGATLAYVRFTGGPTRPGR